MPRRGFTLIELLVVIAIMALLMGLLIPAVTLVKKHMGKVKTVSRIQAVVAACADYKQQCGVYPVDNVGGAFDSGNKLASELDDSAWRGVASTLVDQVLKAGGTLKLADLEDHWKEPIRYRPARWYPYKDGAAAPIDSADPPGRDLFQVWSKGYDLTDQYGVEGSDDIASWTGK